MRHLPGWVVVVVLVSGDFVFGQGRSAGMQGAYVTLARGAEAPAYNPANLTFCSGREVSISFLGLSGWLEDNAFGLADYRRYNGAFLTEIYKSAILDATAGEGLIGRAGAVARPLSISVGPAAISFQTRALSQFTLAEELFSLLLRGNEVDVAYDFVPADGQAMLLSDVALSYGYSPPYTLRGFHSISVGVNGHYFVGSYYGEVERVRARALTRVAFARADGQATIRTARGGQGWGIDLGVTAVITSHFHLGLVAENLVTHLSWGKESERLYADFTLPATNIETILQDDLDLEEVVMHTDTTLQIPAFSTRLPRRWHLSASYAEPRFTLAAQWTGGEAGAAALGGANLALGGEYAPWAFLRLRAGVGYANESGWSNSLGIGLLLWRGRWDFAWQGVGSLNPNAVRGALAATGFYIEL